MIGLIRRTTTERALCNLAGELTGHETAIATIASDSRTLTEIDALDEAIERLQALKESDGSIAEVESMKERILRKIQRHKTLTALTEHGVFGWEPTPESLEFALAIVELKEELEVATRRRDDAVSGLPSPRAQHAREIETIRRAPNQRPASQAVTPGRAPATPSPGEES